jgi:hypothetical protein
VSVPKSVANMFPRFFLALGKLYLELEELAGKAEADVKALLMLKDFVIYNLKDADFGVYGM